MTPRIRFFPIPHRVLIFFASGLVLVAVANAAPPAAPSNLGFESSPAADRATIAWEDNATDEDDFRIEFKYGVEGTYEEFGNIRPPDSTSFSFTSFPPNTEVFFRVRASNLDGFSDYSNEATVVTEANYQIAASCVTVTPGGGFSTVIRTNFEGVVEPQSALPAWMSWDAQSQTLSGMEAPEGIVKVSLSASSGPHSRVRDFFVQVINEAPLVTDPPTAVALVDQPGGLSPIVVDLAAHFEDPDMGRAAAISTPAGPINVGFYDDPIEGAPLTVANFFAYAEAGRWDGSFFHRSVEQFVIQGGGYLPDGISEGSFVGVDEFDSVMNEYSPSRPNICGTIAMAKLGGSPDSATSEFFFSLKDNVSILDPQNGGFTVFGRAAGMDAVDQISAYDTDDYSVTIDGLNRRLDDWPLTENSDNSPLVSELVSMSNVVEIPTLSFAVSGGDAAIATAAIAGSQLTITPVGSGQVDIVVTATDLDGAEVSATWSITISSSYAAWAEEQGLDGDGSAPGENRDGGSLVNLQEYSFGGDPLLASDDSANSPVLEEVEIEGESYDAIVFRHRKSSSDLSYRVQTSPDVSEWTDLWTSADGIDAPLVAELEDADDFWILTVRYPVASGSAGERLFFRTLVGLEAGE